MARLRDPALDLSLRCAAYAVLRQGHPRLPSLCLPEGGSGPAVRVLSKCFDAARRTLSESPEAALFDDLLLPDTVSPDLAQRLNEVVAQTVTTLSKDATADPLGPLFEAASGSGDRKEQGQHFTPPAVVALVLALARADTAANVIDPTCGSGAFLTRAVANPLRLGGAGIWGCELDPLAATLARINLRRAPGATTGHVHTGDILALHPGAHVDGYALPRCEAVVGNLPYVRLHRQDLARWRAALGERWATRDPSLVTRGSDGQPTLRLSGHADLYALLFFHLTDLVAPGGRLAVLTANAYLDAGYGRMLEQLFVRHFRVVALVESRCEHWFADASVNTVITVLERRGAHEPPAGHRTRFVQLTGPLIPEVDGGASVDPDVLAHTIDNVTVPHSADDNAASSGLPYVTVTDDNCRIRLVEQTHLETALTQRDGPWSAYLRAPDLYFHLRQHPALRPTGELLTIRRGVTTNWNAFFYPPAGAAVEADYLVPIVRSPRVSRTIAVPTAPLADRLFVCQKSLDSLQRAGHTGALRWIEGGQQMRNRQGRPISETLKGRPWYRLAPVRYRLLLTKTTHDTHLHRLLDGPAAVDQRLYGVMPGSPADTELVAALLNSSVVALMAEVVGSASLGEGALDLPVTTARERLLMPDPAALTAAGRRRILQVFGRLRNRPVLPVWRELERPDRKELDRAVLAALDVDADISLPRLHAGLTRLTQQRLGLAARRRAQGRRLRQRYQ